jgi:hypothetical protein
MASRLLGIRDLWNHQALFDYMDRYMDLMVGLSTRLSISASAVTEGNDATASAFAPRQSR